MRRHDDIVWNVTGQSLRYRAPQGRPTSADFAVFADGTGDDGTAEFSGTATVDAVDTTVSSASGAQQADPRKVSLASTAGIVVGRKYLLTENSATEWGEVLSIHSGHVRMRDRLLGDYTAAATFQGCDLTAAVDATWVADRNNLSDLADPNPDYRVRWAITIGGAVVPAYSYFELVRAPRALAVDLLDVSARWPGLAEMLDVTDRGDQARTLIESASRIVRVDLAGIDLNDTAIMEDETLDEAIVRAARMVLAEAGIHPRAFSAGEYVAIATGSYERFVEQNFRVRLRAPIASGADSGAESRQAAPYWEK